jgi:hypothetical protein
VENVLERNLTPGVHDAREHSSTGHIRLYCEMSDLLMRLHKPEIAMALEKFGARTSRAHAIIAMRGESRETPTVAARLRFI